MADMHNKPAYENWLRWLVHAAALSPLALLLFQWLGGTLAVDPIQDTMQRTGQSAIILLLISLACTPANIIFGFRLALKFRKPLGLYSFLYASLHFFTFLVLDYQLNLDFILADINQKSYILAGALAFFILAVLALTSLRSLKKRLGKAWKKLHRLVYLAGILAAGHYLWVVKADIRQPLIYLGILVILLMFRLPFVKNGLLRIQGGSQKAK